MTLAHLPEATRLNSIVPYFTMFPLEFPLSILADASPGDQVLDPFCGRGTTNFAARLLGLDSLGVDSSPVAVAITAAKLVSPKVEEVIHEARQILAYSPTTEVPEGEFWDWAYHRDVLEILVRFRQAFLEQPLTPARIALRGIILGALHGPLRTTPSYFSNQMPRNYAPKPGYAVRFWRSRGLYPPKVDVMELIERRTRRFYAHSFPSLGRAVLGDSRHPKVFQEFPNRFRWIITSPPYYGLKTYLPDQWLRLWFLGGPDTVSYSQDGQLSHGSPSAYRADLTKVWTNVAHVAVPGARMVVRFGSINSARVDSLNLIQDSFVETPWRILEVRSVPPPRRRQAAAFMERAPSESLEWDVFLEKT